MEENGWLLKSLKEAEDRVKDLPDWAKDNSSAIEVYYHQSRVRGTSPHHEESNDVKK